MNDSSNKLLKIAYFDEISAIDYLSVFNGGEKETENTVSRVKNKEGQASAEAGGGTGFLGKVLEPFLSINVSGKLEGKVGAVGEDIVRTTISNSVLSDYVSVASDDVHTLKLAPKTLGVYPNSISSVMMYTPLLKMFDFKTEGFNFSLFDETLEKIKGYLELIATFEDGSNQILRFNNRAFRNNYKLVDLTRMDLTFYCVEVGAMKLDQLDPNNEFRFAQSDKLIEIGDLVMNQQTLEIRYHSVMLFWQE